MLTAHPPPCPPCLCSSPPPCLALPVPYRCSCKLAIELGFYKSHARLLLTGGGQGMNVEVRVLRVLVCWGKDHTASQLVLQGCLRVGGQHQCVRTRNLADKNAIHTVMIRYININI